jgi:hypothetical protein
MKINELIEHLTNLKECGYGDYESKVAYSNGRYFDVSGFRIDVSNKEVKIF